MVGGPRVLGWRRDDDDSQTTPDDMLALERQVCFALSVAARTVVAVYRPVLEPLGLTHPQYLVMLALWQHGPLSVKDLSGLLQLDPGTLSPLLKRLEAAGLLRRERDAKDQRNLALALTDKGRALRAEAEKIPAGIVERLGHAGRGADRAAGGADPGDRRLPAGAGRRRRRERRRAA